MIIYDSFCKFLKNKSLKLFTFCEGSGILFSEQIKEEYD